MFSICISLCQPITTVDRLYEYKSLYVFSMADVELYGAFVRVFTFLEYFRKKGERISLLGVPSKGPSVDRMR